MTGGKIGGILLILIILACIGVFGAHFSVPMSGQTTLDRPEESLTIFTVMGFLFDAGTFQVDDVPEWLSLIIDILLIVFIVIIASMFIPTIPG